MSLQTNLRGRLRNTPLSKHHGLMPVYEAIINSIHSIEEKDSWDEQDSIKLIIRRNTQEHLNIEAKAEPIIGFTIMDTGCGFNEANYTSFQTLDSEHKILKGCRGVGRLLWLKTFTKISIKSQFKDVNGDFFERSFNFDSSGVSNHKIILSPPTSTTGTGTIIELDQFSESYRKAVPSETIDIAHQLLEHCLWYFVREEGVPEIIIEDGTQRINLLDLYNNNMHASAFAEKIDILNQSFNLIHIKFRASINKKHQLALCAANRLVKEENIQGKIPGLYNKISDSIGEFTYTCYISSKYLDDNVRSERTSFNIADNFDGIFGETEISLKLIKDRVLERTKIYLKELLEANIDSGKKRILTFISTHAPRYHPIVKHVSQNDLIIDPDKSDKEIELHLHEKWYAIERQLIIEGQNILEPTNKEQVSDYLHRINEYVKKTSDLKKSDLANYVSHRKVIIELLKKSIGYINDDKYAHESMIHELIMPMQKTSDEIFLDSCNLWLIDERLAFHNYLASDKPIKSMPITDSQSPKEPDLISLKVFDNPILVKNENEFPLGSLTVIELKRPMRKDISEKDEKNPINQCLTYLDLVRKGNAKTKEGTLIPTSESVPGYCYIVCDLTENMINLCKLASLTMTADGMVFFGYNSCYKSYIEVISYNQLVRSANERNQAFFNKLGFPI